MHFYSTVPVSRPQLNPGKVSSESPGRLLSGFLIAAYLHYLIPETTNFANYKQSLERRKADLLHKQILELVSP